MAAQLVAKNKHVAAVGFSSTCPFGRVQGQVLEERLKTIAGYQSEEQADTMIARLYAFFDFCTTIDTEEYIKQYPGDTPETMISFSQPVVETLSHLSQPLFIAYGTKDFHSIGCDALPVYFAMSGKHNYQMYPMAGRGHNYELIHSDGSPDWNDTGWHDVTRQFGEFVQGYFDK